MLFTFSLFLILTFLFFLPYNFFQNLQLTPVCLYSEDSVLLDPWLDFLTIKNKDFKVLGNRV